MMEINGRVLLVAGCLGLKRESAESVRDGNRNRILIATPGALLKNLILFGAGISDRVNVMLKMGSVKGGM
jgi:superfamily II DNA/RNA helicase